MTKYDYIEWKRKRIKKKLRKIDKKLSKISGSWDPMFLYCESMIKAYNEEIDRLIQLNQSN